MFLTKATVEVKEGGKVILFRDYDKVVFHGTALDEKGKVAPVVADTPEELATLIKGLLGATISFFQKKIGEKGNGVIELLKQVTYAYDLEVRNKIRTDLISGAEGPEKAIEVQVKKFMEARAKIGRPVSEAFARKKVKENMEEEESTDAAA